MRTSSDRAVAEVAIRGGLAPTEVVEARLRRLRLDARLGIGLAVIHGRLERVELLDGSRGLRLAGAAR